jgi:hypothetical protein
MLMLSVAATFGSHRHRAIIASRACSLAAFQSRKDIPKSFSVILPSLTAFSLIVLPLETFMRVLRCVLEVDHGGVGFGSSAGHRQWAMVDMRKQFRRRPQDGLPHGGQIRLRR